MQRTPPLVDEAEHRTQDAVAVAALDECGGDRVDRHHEVLEVLVGDDHPAEPVVVLTAAHRRAAVGGGRPQDSLHLGDDRAEVGRRQRLEHDRGGAAAADLVGRLHRHVGGGDCEQTVGGRLSEPALTGEDLAQAHQAVPCSWASSLASRSILACSGGWVENNVATLARTLGETM